MNNHLKLAYDAGAHQALEDHGFTKQSGILNPTEEARLARQMVEGGFVGRIFHPGLGRLAGGALGGAAGAAVAGIPGAVAGHTLGATTGSLAGLATAAQRGNRLAERTLAGEAYTGTGISKARRDAVAKAVLAEGSGRKALRTLLKAGINIPLAGGLAAAGLAAGPGMGIPLLFGALPAAFYGGHRAAHALMPVRVPEPTRLERLIAKTPGGKAGLAAAALGAGGLGMYQLLKDD